MRLLFDVDGVLCGYQNAYVQIVNSLYGTSHRAEDVTEWDIERSLNLSEEQERTIHRYIKARGYALHLEPLPGAVDAVRRLMERHDVYFVTSPFRGARDEHLSWTHDREHWLFDHFRCGADRVVHTSSKYLVKGDVLIDDKPSNVAQWQHHHPEGWGLLWWQPYNHLYRGDLMVCHGWEHLEDILELAERGGRGADGPGDAP